jgi:hypothetical protein
MTVPLVVGAITSALWFVSPELAIAFFIASATVVVILSRSRAEPLIREPASPRRRWWPSIGLAVSHSGAFPFITVRRTLR